MVLLMASKALGARNLFCSGLDPAAWRNLTAQFFSSKPEAWNLDQVCDKLLRRLVMIMAAKALAHWAERVHSDLEARQKIAVAPAPQFGGPKPESKPYTLDSKHETRNTKP